MKEKMIVAEINLVYRPKVKASQRPKICASKDAADIFWNLWNKNTIELIEQFKVMSLTRASRVLGVLDVSTGGIGETIADPKIILGAAVKAGATGIILAHNRPSGSFKPSKLDIALTQKIKEATGHLDFTLLDHLIITNGDYFSMADEGLL